MKKLTGVESHSDSDTGTTANDTGSESASLNTVHHTVLKITDVTAVYVKLVCMR